MSEPPVFAVDFSCGNCGNEWVEEYPPGISVSQSRGHRIGAYTKDCDKMGTRCDCCHTIECPVCEIDNVSIEDRNPVVDGDGERLAYLSGDDE